MEKALFGLWGYPEEFLNSKDGKLRSNVFSYLKNLGIDAIELNWSYGISMTKKRIMLYKKLAKENNVVMSLHAPLRINLGSFNKNVLKTSEKDLERCYKLARDLEIDKIILSLGSRYLEDNERSIALNNTIEILKKFQNKVNTRKIKIYIEPRSNYYNLGSLDEIFTICEEVSGVYPCLDLGLIHGELNEKFMTSLDIIKFLEHVIELFGEDIKNNLYIKFSYASKGDREVIKHHFGEKRLGQTNLFKQTALYYPKVSDYVDAIKKLDLRPLTIYGITSRQTKGIKLIRDVYFFRQ